MYILLTGAIKNVGDFLIAERGKKLLQNLRPDREIYELSRYQSLEDCTDLLDKAKAIILCGGPGFMVNMYPQVFALVKDLNNIKIPIISLGMGWFGVPGDAVSLNTYQFSQNSRILLNRLSNDYPFIGCRDYYTARVLRKNGYNNALMTGCPAWYDVDYLDNEFEQSEDITNVVISTPASVVYFNQCIQVMNWVKTKYIGANLYCTFHRGIAEDKYTNSNASSNLMLLKLKAEELGFQTLDLSYDANRMSIYDKADIHIGYRVHAHIYCMSHRKRSILINEDGRGTACCHALGLEGVDAFTIVNENKTERHVFPSNTVVEELSLIIGEFELGAYHQFDSVKTTLINNYRMMEAYINALP